jgi:vaccinia related kinase
VASSIAYTHFLPKIEQYGETFIILERLDMDVRHFLSSKNVTRKTIHSLIVQTISALEFLHSFGYSHGDIKTENMLVDLKDPEMPRLKLTDLGLALPFESRKLPVSPHRGTLLFISEDAHRGVVPNKRSDLENLGWTIVYSFFNINLPWKNIKRKSSILKEKVSFKKTIQTRVQSSRLKLYFNHIFSLSYDDAPKYSMLVGLFS